MERVLGGDFDLEHPVRMTTATTSRWQKQKSVTLLIDSVHCRVYSLTSARNRSADTNQCIAARKCPRVSPALTKACTTRHLSGAQAIERSSFCILVYLMLPRLTVPLLTVLY